MPGFLSGFVIATLTKTDCGRVGQHSRDLPRIPVPAAVVVALFVALLFVAALAFAVPADRLYDRPVRRWLTQLAILRRSPAGDTPPPL